ncbi:protein E6-like [Ipomoea triloba]|uniref:protein E6-like n=1 Tax=Ipomoea triloba TaxID=35885 RepID=UPI00125CDDF0|nr:protein E6-like [Ipomoea triloba]
MAVSGSFSIFFLLALVSSLQIIQARETKYFFNKIPGNNNNNYGVNSEQTTVIPQQQEQNFIPENENGGLDQPYTTTTNNNDDLPYKTEEVPNKRYLPRNYNPVSYVTVPEDNNADSKFAGEEFAAAADNNNRYNSRGNYYNSRSNNYYGGGGQEERFPANNNRYNAAAGNKVEKMGMSDTRFLENGRYYYDTNTEKYARHPLENAGINLEDFKSQFENSNNNFMENNNYQNDEQFQDEDDLP